MGRQNKEELMPTSTPVRSMGPTPRMDLFETIGAPVLATSLSLAASITWETPPLSMSMPTFTGRMLKTGLLGVGLIFALAIIHNTRKEGENRGGKVIGTTLASTPAMIVGASMMGLFRKDLQGNFKAAPVVGVALLTLIASTVVQVVTNEIIDLDGRIAKRFA